MLMFLVEQLGTHRFWKDVAPAKFEQIFLPVAFAHDNIWNVPEVEDLSGDRFANQMESAVHRSLSCECGTVLLVTTDSLSPNMTDRCMGTPRQRDGIVLVHVVMR